MRLARLAQRAPRMIAKDSHQGGPGSALFQSLPICHKRSAFCKALLAFTRPLLSLM